MIDIPALVEALARTYDSEPAARAALNNINFPMSAVPAWDRPEFFWSDVVHNLLLGRVENGISLLILQAREKYPASKEWQELAASISSEPPDSQGEPAVHSVVPAIAGGTTGTDWLRRQRFNPFSRRRDLSQISLRKLEDINFHSDVRRVESLGTVENYFNNSGSSSASLETLRISKSTQFVLKFDVSRATFRNGGASVGLSDFAKIQGKLQSSLLSRFSLTETTTLTVERTSQVKIEAQAHVKVDLHWKCVWQDGIIALRTRSGLEVEIPYSVTVGLTFDQTLTDV
jgi:Effector-associated domain 1